MGQPHLRHRHLSSRLYQQLLKHRRRRLHHCHLHHQTSPHCHSASTSASMMRGKYIRKTFSCTRSSLVRPLWLANEVWIQLQAFWASEDFQQESSKNKANRAVNPIASSTVYRGGSSSVGIHKRKLVRDRARSAAKQMELFERCYKKKDDGGWSGPRVAGVTETFQKLMEDHQPQPTGDDGPAESEASMAMTEQQMWLAAVGERTRTVYSALVLRPTVPPGPTPIHHRRHPPPPPQNPAWRTA
ncbi:UNVERIFIED_CONTAM: hypothetical protein Slati_2671700 [Sesamum latifolium]|uniref:Uncharacterized protein n=1 Tax=Sesamum latifolium TaxID=2727402 RepID=A0AAW2VUF7_9LAMI